MNWLNATPLRALVAGPEMVLLFFVLSGMVLALPRLAGHGASYGRYLLTRVLRLYPAAWVVTAIAALALLVEPAHPQAGLSTSWLANEFSAPINPADAFHYVGLIVPFDPTRLDGVLWSLELERRASLLLPLLVWFACRCGPVVTLVSAIALIVYGTTASLAAASWIWTTVVIGCFLLGILLHATATRSTGRGQPCQPWAADSSASPSSCASGCPPSASTGASGTFRSATCSRSSAHARRSSWRKGQACARG